MEKLNDYFLNLLSNPTFSASDFALVGLSVDNTSILDKNVYLNSNYIKNLDIFKTDGYFDLSKLDNFYNYAKLGFLDLTKLKETDDLGKTWMAYRNDISMPESLRDYSPLFKIKKVANPLRLLKGFVSFGLSEEPIWSAREIAQTLLTLDPVTGKYGEAPNDTWFDNFIHPKVLATWDEDGVHEDPITGEMIEHKKGDKKLNKNGTYYYEPLGDRSVYGKEVLSGWDTLTTDGSFMNKLDFLDSDDVEKSGKGSFMRAAALIVPAFIPGVNTWYIGTRVGLGLALILPTVGKMILGSDSPILTKIEAWDKALSFSQSDYVKGSLAANGQVLLDSHLWSWETAFKLIADVFTQLAELRWMFSKASSLFSGLDKEVIVSKKALEKWIEDYIAKHQKTPTLEEILKGLELGEEKYKLQQSMLQALEWSRALMVLKEKLKGALELGSKVSMAYMTGITTADSYGEMKLLGATDVEAALFTLGYSLAEFGLLNTQMGKWILPELKQERTHMKNVASKAMEKIKKATEEADTKTDIGKIKWWSKLANIGKNMYYGNLGLNIKGDVAGAIVSGMGAESLEETSEELLLDLAKVFYNEAASLVGGQFKFLDAFSNVFDRYALSFLGGALGGGIAGVLSGTYKQAKYDRNMTQELASREIVDYVQLGKGQELIETVNKMTFGNRYLDEQGNQTNDYTKSLDFLVKANFARLVNDILDILTVNGADMNTAQLMDVLTPKDIRYGMLASLATKESNAILYYINRYNELSTDLVKLSLKLKELLSNKTDEQKRNEPSESDEEKVLKEQIKEKKEELDKFKDGTESIEFMLDSMFEMTSKVSSVFLNNFEQYAEDKYKKSIDELDDEELATAKREFDALKPLTRDLIRKGRLIHILNMEWLAKMMEEYDETYFKDENEAIANLNEIIFGNRNLINNHPNESVPLVLRFFAIEGGEINEFLKLFEIAIMASLDETKMKPFIEKLKSIETDYAPFLKRIGISETLDSFEKIENLPEELKSKLFDLFDVNNIDELKEDFEKEVEGNKVLNIEAFNNVLLEEDIRNGKDQTERFKLLLLTFLKTPEVKAAIIKRLSSAKYMLPSVKIALDLFFDSKLQYVDEYDTVELNKKEIEDYKNSYKDLPSSPVDLYLKNVLRTLKSNGVNLTPTIINLDNLIITLSRVKDLENFLYDEPTQKQIDDALKVILIAKVGLLSAATKIDVDLSDAYGFNAAVNLLLEKRKDGEKHLKLAEIRDDIAVGITQDIERYEQTLLYYKTLFGYNSNAVLNEHDKTYKRQSLNLYNKLKNLATSIELPDWKDLDKLKEALEDPDLTEVMKSIEDKKDSNTEEFKLKLTLVRLKLDRVIHNFLIENKNKSLKDLLKHITITYKVGSDSYTVLNSLEESLNDKDLLWYLAEMSAADPDILMNEYQSGINENFAPVIGQEEAIKKVLSFLVNPKEFKRFADAWNELVMEDYREKMKTATELEQGIIRRRTGNTLVNAYRAIFVEGVPGSGKSSAVINTVTDILRKHHPDVLKKVVIVSNSKKNAETLTKNLGFESDKTQHFGIEEFRNKVMNNYEPPIILKDGLFLFKDDDTYYDKNRYSRRYKKATLNPDGLDATFLIIDEATSLSLMDAAMFDDWMEAKGIYGLYAGDFDLLGTSGQITVDKLPITISLNALNYISTHKLGLVIRGNNIYKSNNTISLKINKHDFIHSLLNKGKINPISFSYYLDDTGLYGDIIVRPDQIVDSSGVSNVLDADTKSTIDKMIKSLPEGDKINYIYDTQDSLMYKYLEENYKDKINKLSTSASLSLEGKYYIVDIRLAKNLNSNDASGLITAERLFNMLYTAVSRAKLGTLIYDENEVISERIRNQRAIKLVKSEIAKDNRKDYGNLRKRIIKNVLPEGTPEKFEKLLWDNEETTVENPAEDHTEEEETNLPYIPDIENSRDGEMNMMIHTFNCHEIGGTIDENGLLVLGKYHNERTDNAHGLVKLLKLPVTDGKLSVEDTKKVIKAIDEIRAIGTYGESNNIIKSNIVTTIKNIFGLDGKDLIEVRFIYKNSSEPDTLTTRGKLLKFFKSTTEKIRYLFTGETDLAKKDKQETPSDHTIGLEIFINKKQIDIPIGVLTNPSTIIKAKGFEQLKSIYDSVRGDKNLGNFTSELKRRKQAGEIIPHLNEMLLLLELYQWRYNHKDRRNIAVRLREDFVLNLGRITGIQVPPTGPNNLTGARGVGYLDEDFYYPGRPVTLEEYRREMPNRRISSVLEGITGDFSYDGKVYIKKAKPFVLMSDYYTNYTDRLLYEEYIKEVLENKPRKVTRVYVNFPKKLDIGYFLWNQLEALKREGNSTKAKDIDYSVGNKLTSFRLLSFMLKDDSNFLQAYKNFILLLKADDTFVIDKDSHERSTLERISRLQLIMSLLEQHESSLKDILKEVLANDESGIQRKVIETITKKKLFLDYLDLNIEDLKGKNDLLYKLFIPDGALNPDSNIAPIGNTKYSLRTALLFEFRRLLLGGFFLQDGKTVYGISTPYKPNTYIEKNGEEFVFKDFQKDRIEALEKDLKKNGWTGVLVNTNLVRNSEMAVSVGSQSYKVAKIQTQDDTYVSSESFYFNGKLPTAAVIIDVAPLLKDILSKAVIMDKDGKFDTSEEASTLSDEEKKQIYLENMGAYLEGRRPSAVKTRDDSISKPFNTIINSLIVDGNTTEEVLQIVKNYLLNNKSAYNADASSEELLKLIFANNKNFGVLKDGDNFKVVKVSRGHEIIIRPQNLNILYIINPDSGNIYKMTINNLNTESSVSLSELAKLTNLSSQELLFIEQYKNKKLSETKFKVGDSMSIVSGEFLGDWKITNLTFNPDGDIIYELNNGVNTITLLQEVVDTNDSIYKKQGDINEAQLLLDEIMGEKGKANVNEIQDYVKINQDSFVFKDIDEKTKVNFIKALAYFIIEKTYDDDNIIANYIEMVDSKSSNLKLIEDLGKTKKEEGYVGITISNDQLLDLVNKLIPTVFGSAFMNEPLKFLDENNCKIAIKV